MAPVINKPLKCICLDREPRCRAPTSDSPLLIYLINGLSRERGLWRKWMGGQAADSADVVQKRSVSRDAG